MRKSAVRPLLFLLVTILLISGNTARSQNDNDDWRRLGTLSLQGEVYSVYHSPGRTVRRNGLVQAWFKVVEPDSSNTSHSFALMQFNCRRGKYRILQQSIFNRRGGGSGSIKPTEWQYPYPESVPEMEYGVMCHQAKVERGKRY